MSGQALGSSFLLFFLHDSADFLALNRPAGDSDSSEEGVESMA